MIQDGAFRCNSCNEKIEFSKEPVRIVVEFVKGDSDRHYCEDCFRREIQLEKVSAYPDVRPRWTLK